MSLQDEFDPHTYVSMRASSIVRMAQRSGGIIRATAEAQRLLDEGVAGYLTLQEVADEIALCAADKGVPVELGEAAAA